MKDHHTKVPPSKCPTCQYKMDCATSAYEPEHLPREGDATICIKCGEFLMFGKGMALRLPTREEHETMGNDPRIIAAQIVVRGFAGKPDHLRYTKKETAP